MSSTILNNTPRMKYVIHEVTINFVQTKKHTSKRFLLCMFHAQPPFLNQALGNNTHVDIVIITE